MHGEIGYNDLRELKWELESQIRGLQSEVEELKVELRRLKSNCRDEFEMLWGTLKENLSDGKHPD